MQPTSPLSSAEDYSFSLSWKTLLPPAFLIAGNVLGVGLLALPIKLGISGYLPSALDIIIICLAMIVSALVIAERLPREKKIFDIPSFFHKEMGSVGRWIAIICNLIILYGIIVAYLSAISTIVYALIPIHISKSIIIITYFAVATSIIVFGRGILQRASTILMIGIWIAFVILIFLGAKNIHPSLLNFSNWSLVPIGLPVVISTFHFHNVIPTVSSCVNHNRKALRYVIFLGVGIGLIMNLTWTTIVLSDLSHAAIFNAFLHGMPATVPMSQELHSSLFTTTGLFFAALAVTASYAANGSGLFGFIRDMLYNYLNVENSVIASIIAFAPPLIIALIYPNIFLSALDIVGGIGEAMLFAVLPGLILVKMMKNKTTILANIFKTIGYIIFVIGVFVMIFVFFEKLGITHFTPSLPKM